MSATAPEKEAHPVLSRPASPPDPAMKTQGVSPIPAYMHTHMHTCIHVGLSVNPK